MRYFDSTIRLLNKFLKYFCFLFTLYIIADFFQNNLKINIDEFYFKRIILGAVIVSIIFMYLDMIRKEK